eukprot:3160736-Pleurochrysis_carterae.AAC.1
MGYYPRPDRMHPIGSYILRGAGCHDREDHYLYGAPRHIKILAIPSPLSPATEESDYTSLSLNDVNSANHHPFPGQEPTMPGFDPNHIAHQQPHVVKQLQGFDPNHQITAPG